MASSHLAGIILAAGKGTRMRSENPKGLFEVCGVPMVGLVGRAMQGAGVTSPIVVIGHQGEKLQTALGETYQYVWQHEQLGTGHAALMARDLLAGHEGPVLVAPGDAPLLTAEALSTLVREHEDTKAACTLATARLHDPTGYGRIVRDAHGKAQRVVEEKDASPKIRAIQEVCTSLYCFDGPTLFRLLPTLNNRNAQGEYYLTDMIAAIYESGGLIETRIFEDPDLLKGVNDRWQLAEAAVALRKRINRMHCLNGVTILDPDTTYIGLDVRIEPDAVLHPMTTLQGQTSIGAGAQIGPNTNIRDSRVGRGTNILQSLVAESEIGDDVKIGPFANIRPGTVVGNGSKIGNFVETKKSRLAERVSVSHLTYLGDAEVGEDTNIGAGTITCNYDGKRKHPTKIGKRAFVGSNSTLVAPVTIGDGAVIAAGSAITQDVPADALALGRQRQEVKEGWAEKWRKKES